MDESRSLEKVVGDNVRRVRLFLGLTLNDVAVQLRGLGLPWSTGRLGNIEAGRGTASIQVVLALAMALTDAQRGPLGERRLVTPEALLRSETPVRLSSAVALTQEGYDKLLSGSGPVGAVDVVGGRKLLEDAGRKLTAWSESLPPGITHGEVQAGRDHFDLADARAAKKLGIEKDEFLRLCLIQWRMVLSDKVDELAPEGATPQKRGRITRELVADLQEAMARGDDRAV